MPLLCRRWRPTRPHPGPRARRQRRGLAPRVIGIVAARLMERFSRPVIVISMHEGEGRGSGRPDPFDLHSALADCAQYLTRFGGHAAAAGVEIEEENLAAFRQTINAWAAAHAARPRPSACGWTPPPRWAS
ncbi:DHHA1 domain-containing protein [Gemmiger formicilis]|nr:DHHA1 domain-containing protein [Gemmiger formicilis]